MSIFFHILGYNILPIFILITLGYILGKKFELDILTLSKLNFYLFVPAFIFVNLYTTTLSFDMFKVFLCAGAMLFTNDLLGRIIARIRHYDIGMTNAFKNSIMFNNSGNIGLSLITLVFTSTPFVFDGKTPYLQQAIATQIVILVIQNISTNTLGFFNAGRAHGNVRQSILQIFTMPAIYIIPTAFFCKSIPFDFTATLIWPALEYLRDGLVPVALLTLGVQLSQTQFDLKNPDVHLSAFTRLIIGPVLAVLFIHIGGFTGVVAQTILIAYSVPTAVNTALIAIECDSCQNFAAQAVMVSTVFSAVTLSLAIYAARIFFPV
ncbi:putative membrane protein [Propionispora sp. 2/2-37]|uniref:AEC family transporter n=1 Tax=Propionispora sp. 2/2-37 TaxID=1677858 RepID=UPI0006BB5E45|nr:putative membrane protein [Propionispora sp. 2/2-37]